jgi:hypothetical protein
MATGQTKCRGNGHTYHWSWYCGDRVCDVCIKHENRTYCDCGWPESVRRKESNEAVGSGDGSMFGEA